MALFLDFPYIRVNKTKPRRMKKEFGKWLMDIAKYLTTAVLLSSMFANIEKLWIIYVFALSGIVSTLAVGLWLVRDNKRKGE